MKIIQSNKSYKIGLKLKNTIQLDQRLMSFFINPKFSMKQKSETHIGNLVAKMKY
ncbi:hypothetical protein [Epilithonimonas hominis]|uniref:hypothetical protein n=1 Tax=Epilithonimonas hominis TaxID=420404 RepID=UPI0028A7CD5D|nr:hypothetical protein [Epilithonimonas hominis]